MSDPFDTLYGSETPEQESQQPKKVGLAIGARMSPDEHAAKFVNRKMTAADYTVGFEVQNEKGEWVNADEAAK